VFVFVFGHPNKPRRQPKNAFLREARAKRLAVDCRVHVADHVVVDRVKKGDNNVLAAVQQLLLVSFS
jgi:hypothetical protein